MRRTAGLGLCRTPWTFDCRSLRIETGSSGHLRHRSAAFSLSPSPVNAPSGRTERFLLIRRSVRPATLRDRSDR